MKHGAIILAGLGLLLVPLGFTAAAVLHVPGDYPTLQAALAVAVSGDTVLAACGTYFEHGLQMAMGVTLASQTGMPDCVTIDGQGLGRIVRADAGYTPRSIRGVTLRDGIADRGGGIYARRLELAHCIVEDCRATYHGAGVHAEELALEDVAFRRNVAGGDGGAIYADMGLGPWRDVIAVDNAASRGSAIYLAYAEPDLPSNRIDGLTLAFNAATGGGGAFFTLGGGEWPSWPVISRAIIAYNAGGGFYYEDYDPLYFNGDPVLSCSDVFGNTGGDYAGGMPDQTGWYGNLSADPLFCGVDDRDLSLMPGSPCLPEGNHCRDLMGAVAEPCDMTALPGEPEPAAIAGNALYQNMPNPFNPTTEIRFDLPAPAAVSLAVYDVAGRLVATLLEDAYLPAGRHVALWEGREASGRTAASGVYFCRLEAGDYRETLKMTLVK